MVSVNPLALRIAPAAIREITASPISRKTKAALAKKAKAAAADAHSEISPTPAVVQLTKGHTVKMNEFLFPLRKIDNYVAAVYALESGEYFRVGGHEENRPVIDKFMIPLGTIVILVYGARRSLQKWYRVE